MRITFINVGYGDAILFQAANRYMALLDGGSALPEEFAGNPYRIRGADYLRKQNVSHLDDVIISHIHEDHVCGLERILNEVTVGHLYVPYPTETFLQGKELQANESAQRNVHLYTNALNAYRRILLNAEKNGTPVTVIGVGDTLSLTDDLVAQVLAPKDTEIRKYMALIEEAYGSTADPTDLLRQLDATSNRTSLLLRFDTESIRFLTAADSCPNMWDEVPFFYFKNVSVFKLPHHGQIDSIDEHYMKNMPLSYVITTSASDRRYNSANRQVYERLSNMYPEDRQPTFLFSDEVSYPPFFFRPEGFQAISLEVDSGRITPEFIKFIRKGDKQ